MVTLILNGYFTHGNTVFQTEPTEPIMLSYCHRVPTDPRRYDCWALPGIGPHGFTYWNMVRVLPMQTIVCC